MKVLASGLALSVVAAALVAGQGHASRQAVFVPQPADANWPVVHGEPGGTRYSLLRSIDRTNVARLTPAWTYRTGDADPEALTTIECTPVVVDAVMFLTTATVKVVALNAATGEPFWTFDPFAPDAPGVPRNVTRRARVAGVNRGVALWPAAAGATSAAGTGRRVFVGTNDGRLIAIDASSGRPIDSFGQGGAVQLSSTLAPEYHGRGIGMTSPPAVFEDLVIAGVAVGEGPEPAAAGDVLAFDARTGKLRWRFQAVPGPGQPGHDTWARDSWRARGGANAWSGVTLDKARGLVFAGTGSAAFDFYGGDRLGDNLYANSTLALDARTGRLRWHYQVVRHDVWDYDIPTPPVLVRITHDGAPVDAVAQVTKTGFVYLFERESGRPLFDVVDRPVPASDVPGERTAATQPVPSSPPAFIRQTFREEDVFGTTPEHKAEALARFRQMRHGTIFTPPSLEGTVSLPGTRGGATWSGASFDPTRGRLFVNANEIANVLKLIPPRPDRPQPASLPYTIDGYRQFLDRDGYPAITPPWGTVTGIDLGAGRIAWQVPLGEHPELAAKGLRRTGTENFGGTIVTAGGVVFIGGAKDEKLHAFDADTGALLWEHALGAGGYATPATYAVGGRQFVVIAAGGGGKPRTRSGDAFVAFALEK